MNQVKFSKIIDNAVTSKSFSGVVSIHQLDKVLYEKAFGFADHSNKLENKIDTRFGIASGTKFLTALAVGKLIEAKITFVFNQINRLHFKSISKLLARNLDSTTSKSHIRYPRLL